MPHRFFCPDLVEAGQANLTETEAHHLVHVLRAQPDDLAELFNGAGLVATCRIRSIRKRDVELEILGSRRDEPLQPRLALATAVPKGDRFDWLIEKATELGVQRLIPLVTQRSVVDPRASKLDKLRQTVIAACKQSGRNDLMEISCVTSWADFVRTIAPDYQVLIAHPRGDAMNSLERLAINENRPTLFAVGPEGGFSEAETESGQAAGAELIHLGRQIRRIETAAIALAAQAS